MKKLFLLTCLTACLFSACSIFDIDEISDRVGALEDRVAELEELCNSINSDISSLNTIVKALQTPGMPNDVKSKIQPKLNDLHASIKIKAAHIFIHCINFFCANIVIVKSADILFGFHPHNFT